LPVGLSATADAEVDLLAGRGDDGAVADDKRAIRLRADLVGREWNGLPERRDAKARCQQQGERTRRDHPRVILRSLSVHGWFSFFGFVHHATRNRLCDTRDKKQADAFSSIAGDGAPGENSANGPSLGPGKGRQHYAKMTVL